MYKNKNKKKKQNKNKNKSEKRVCSAYNAWVVIRRSSNCFPIFRKISLWMADSKSLMQINQSSCQKMFEKPLTLRNISRLLEVQSISIQSISWYILYIYHTFRISPPGVHPSNSNPNTSFNTTLASTHQGVLSAHIDRPLPDSWYFFVSSAY